MPVGIKVDREQSIAGRVSVSPVIRSS